MRVVLNQPRQHFQLSYEALLAIARRKGITLYGERYVNQSKREMILLTENNTHLNFVDIWPSPEVGAYRTGWESKFPYPRNDPDLLAVVEAMGAAACDDPDYGPLRIIEIPDDAKWHLCSHYDDYSGHTFESIHEDHRIWGNDIPPQDD